MSEYQYKRSKSNSFRSNANCRATTQNFEKVAEFMRQSAFEGSQTSPTPRAAQ